MERTTNRSSIITARIIPAILAALVIYASYVLIGPLTINYLFNPPAGAPPRIAAGIAIPIVWGVLLIPLFASWLRLLIVVWHDPGYIPLGPDPPQQQQQSDLERQTRRRRSRDASEHLPDLLSILTTRPSFTHFWAKDVFVCDSSGLPIWCHECNAWKPDRTHHNQDVGRCTRKMDHFCPWVGGVVGENAMKFFLQFLTYAFIFSTYLMTVFAVFVKEKKDTQWIVALSLAAFFCFFTVGMVLNTMHLVVLNMTSVEHAGMVRRRKLFLAVLLPPEMQHALLAPPAPAHLSPMSTGSTDDSHCNPPHTTSFRDSYRTPLPTTSKYWHGTITYPLTLPLDRPPVPAPEPRTFAIISVPPKLNPWTLNTIFANCCAVMGNSLAEWLVPYRFSPCCDHSSKISEFALGPQFEALLAEVGLVQARGLEVNGSEGKVKKSHRKRRLDSGWQNGERPDWWASENEARRLRKGIERVGREERRLEEGRGEEV